MGRRIFFLDIDFTILRDDGSVPAENIEAIRETLERGNCVAISTGRPACSAVPIAERLGMLRKNCYLVSFNGAVIYDLSTGELLRDLRMPDEYAAYLFSEAKRAGIYMQAYDEDGFLTAGICPESEYYHETIGTPFKVVDDLYDMKIYNTPKVLSLDLTDPKPLREFRNSLLEWEKGKCVSYFSRPEMLEYCFYKATKASGIAFFEDCLGIAHEDTIAAGDAENDISMIEAAGIGVAMKNGADHVKTCADYVTERDNNNGGVAEIIRRFG